MGLRLLAEEADFTEISSVIKEEVNISLLPIS